MTYDSFIRNLNARGMFRIRPGLSHIQKVLAAMGNPQDRYPTIHIAGTNGKGSVAAALESVLQANGYRTGLYTSPHLVDLRERVRVDGKPLVRQFMGAAQQVHAAEKRLRCPLTYFELVTAVAFQAFALQKVQIAVIECGMGGRWDATNAIRKPLLSILTSIGLDHTQWLGETEYEIAGQKAGIIKPGSVVISGVRGSGRKAITAAARKIGAKCYQIDAEFRSKQLTSSWRSNQQVLAFLYKGSPTEIVPFGLLGSHQADNAAVVLAACNELKKMGYRVTGERRDKGLRNVNWPGRLQLLPLPKSAPVLLDGAHNPPATRQLIRELKNSAFRNIPKTFVYSAFKNKDFHAMGELIAPYAAEVCIAPMHNARSASLAQLRSAFRGVRGPVRTFNDPLSALRGALDDTPREGLVIVTGSLFLVGEIFKSYPTLRRQAILHV